LIAAGGIAAVLLLRWLGVRAKLVYVLPGVVVWAGILSAGPFSMDLALRMAAIVSPISGWMFGEALKMWWEDYRRKRLTVSDSMVRSAANAYASAACDDGHRYPTGPNNDKHKEYMRKALLEVLSR
jgi:Na+/H+ antiporter NhaA